MSKRTRRDEEGGLATRTQSKTKKPRMYKVLLHNDDYTTMEFVVWLLQRVFKRTQAESTRIMLHIHQTGIGVAGVYTREIAETRMIQVLELAEQNGHPLQCTMEPE